MPPSLRSALALAAALALLGACAVGPDYVAPALPALDRWHQELVKGLADGEAHLETWWTTLDDPQLTALIERAREGNLDLRAALQRIDEARARRGIAVGDWFPDLDGAGDYQRSRTSEEISAAVPAPQSRTDSFFDAGFDASWEIDFFGRIRRSVEAADADLQASVEDYRDVLVLLFSDVARRYIEARTLQLRVGYAESNVEIQQGSLRLTEERHAAGLVGLLDVRQAQLNLARTEALIPRLREDLARSIHRLGVLLGEVPRALYDELAAPAPIPRPPAEVLVGLPADLLRQRPDLRRAERDLAAQTARIGVATADLYPRFALLGTFAFSATDVTDWFTGDAINYGFGPAFQWNLFDGGRVRSNIRAQDALTEQALTRYEQTLLDALEETENAMVGFVEEQVRRDALERSVDAAAESVKLVDELYRLGLTDFQNVLDTQRALFDQQDEYARSNGRVTQTLVDVYKALGGGW